LANTRSSPSILDVALAAGVSPATVSRVINNSARVSEPVRLKVTEAAAQVGYFQHGASRNQPPSAGTIAVIITDLLNPFFPEIVRGVEEEANIDGYNLMLFDTAEDLANEMQVLQRLASAPIDGVIVCASRVSASELIAFQQKRGLPMVVINRFLDRRSTPCIMVDFINATYRSGRHLLDLGHQRIAYLAGPGNSEASLSRRHGLEKAISEAGLVLRPDFCLSSLPSVAGGFQATSALLSLSPEERPTAIQSYNDIMALGALHAARAHHLRVPEDISIVGFDDIAMAAHSDPPLTTIAQPKYEMGKLAMRTMRQIRRGGSPLGDGYMLVESPLIVRESTGPAPLLHIDN
jgi:DNA-binding LacI/PurR family transcriptional regulator